METWSCVALQAPSSCEQRRSRRRRQVRGRGTDGMRDFASRQVTAPYTRMGCLGKRQPSTAKPQRSGFPSSLRRSVETCWAHSTRWTSRHCGAGGQRPSTARLWAAPECVPRLRARAFHASIRAAGQAGGAAAAAASPTRPAMRHMLPQSSGSFLGTGIGQLRPHGPQPPRDR